MNELKKEKKRRNRRHADGRKHEVVTDNSQVVSELSTERTIPTTHKQLILCGADQLFYSSVLSPFHLH